MKIEQQRKKRVALYAAPLVIVIAMVMLAPTVSAAGLYDYAPYNTSGFGRTPTGYGIGANNVITAPYANVNTGIAGMNVGSWAGAFGAYQIDTHASFFGQVFSISSTGYFTMTYCWKLTWNAAVTTSLSILGNGVAEESIKLWGNLAVIGSGSWVLSNPALTTVTSMSFGGGISWLDGKTNYYYYVTFGASLAGGYSYQFYTDLTTHDMAAAVGYANANAATNVQSATLVYCAITW